MNNHSYTNKYQKKCSLFLFTFLIGMFSYAQTYMENFYSIGEDWVTMGTDSYFFANTIQGENGLWKTDGTQKGTQLVKEIVTQTYEARNLFVYNNELYFAAYQQEVGVELWKSDGTPTGTNLMMDINTGSASSWPSNFTIYDDKLYFTASDQYTSGRKKLFRTDGTVEGTGLAMEIFDADAYEQVSSLTVANGKLYFVRSGVLYETNGTQAGTKNTVVDGLNYNINSFHAFADGIYFTTDNYNKTYVRLYRLTDLDNYTMLKEFSTESHYGLELYGLTEVGDKIIFSLVSGETYTNVQDALWTSDGTPEGTIELMIQGGDNDLWFEPHFSGFVEYNGEVYFNAGPKTNGALWKTNGTIQGTTEIIADAAIRDEAPMIILDDKLYYMGGNSLFEFDFQKNENSSIWPFQLYRKSTGDKFFIQSDGQFVYATVKNERQKDAYNIDLFHTGSNPIINVKVPWNILNGQSLRLDTKIDSLVKKEINIQNLGNASLAFSQVFVSGEGFYINDDVEIDWYQQESQISFPRQIGSTERGIFEIGFLPGMEGVYSGHLIIRSNDTSQPEFRIKLEGYASEVSPESINGTFPTDKEIKWDNTGLQIQLDNSFISENATIGTVVGVLTISSPEESFTYQMVQGAGSDDNSIFSINSDKLIIGGNFQVNNKKTYTVRVKATGDGGTTFEESFVVGINEESSPVEIGTCDKIAIPLTSDLIAVDFINDTDAIAVGAKGVILKSVDKGANWQHLNVIERTTPSGGLYPYPARLTDVNFVDDTTGFITGDNVLLRTDNAGISWKPLQMNNIPLYGQYGFIALNSEILFLFIDNYLYKSTDGGKTWLNPFYMGLHDNRSVYFYNETLGFISDTSGGYAITKDGGLSWTKYELTLEELSYDEDMTSFTFVDELLGYAATSKGKVLKSEDGGENWIIVNSEYRNGVNEIHFFDENRGYMVNGTMFETIDGGITWTSVQTSTCSHLDGIATNGLGDRIAVGSGCYSNGRSIYIAPSSGSWVEISSIYGTADVRNIIFSDQQAYLFSTSQSRTSYDGGNTWKELITPIDGQIAFAEKLGNALLVKYWNGPFYRSTDSGLNWEVVGGGTSFGKFDILDQNTIIAFNADGDQLAKSIDGGVNWNPIIGETLYQSNVVDFVNETTGFVGGFPNMSRTTDGGASWEVLTFGPNESHSVYAITFITEQIGVISTNDGYYKTIDGGDSWIKLSLQIGQTNEILAVNELEWYLASDRYIYGTYDGGATWELYFSNNDEILDFDIVDGKFYISDDDGAVSRIDDDIPPLNAGYISGDLSVRTGTEEIYTVLKHSDNKYAWEVTGGQNLMFEDNFARIIWDTPGEYTLKVIPYATCQMGNASEIIVSVYDNMLPPQINGPTEVVENSQVVVYSTPDEDQVRYLWSVTGQQSFQVDGNSLIVDWGGIGQQEIGLIKIDLESGIQVYNSLDVNVLPQDPFTILQTNASCRETANGSLQITSRIPSISYGATLLDNGNESSIEFTDEILFDNLRAGIYDLCIEDIESGKEYCYQFMITEPEPFEVSAKTSSASSKEVSLKFNGGIAPYKVLINGRQIVETSQTTFTFTAENGDVLEVLSSGTCAFSHSEVLNFLGDVRVSPNPVESSFVAVLGDEFSEESEAVSIRVFTVTGRQVLQFTTSISNRSIQCDVSTLSPGIFLVQVGDSEKTSFKIIKK